MSVEIPISGYPDQLSEIHNGDVILFESEEDLIPTFLSHDLGHSYLKDGGKVLYITSRTEKEVNTQLLRLDSKGVDFDIYEKVDPKQFTKAFSTGAMIIIDSIEYLIEHLQKEEYIEIFEGMKQKCKESGSILLMIGRIDLLDPMKARIIRHNVDGILQFLHNERPEGINRFILIPKWTDGKPYDMKIYFKYQVDRITIDLRSRVV
jgi:hypothetical protein